MKNLDKNTRLALYLLLFFVVMSGLSFAAVPLYRMFCAATGFNGTTQRAAKAPAKQFYYPAGQMPKPAREILVTFDGNVDKRLPWTFGPEIIHVKAKVGEVVKIKYRAHNRGPKALVGTATYNVQPDKAGSYFNKIQCFCFTEQVIGPNETVELPVQFFIDPSINNNREANDVRNITLSYTFFLAKDQSKAQSVDNVNETQTNSSNKSFSH